MPQTNIFGATFEVGSDFEGDVAAAICQLKSELPHGYTVLSNHPLQLPTTADLARIDPVEGFGLVRVVRAYSPGGWRYGVHYPGAWIGRVDVLCEVAD